MSKRNFTPKNEPIHEEAVEPIETNVEAPVEEVEEVVAKTGVVTNCEKLNVRSTPNQTSSKNIIKVIDKGTTVILGEEIDDFVRVNVDGENGYCMKKFIE